MTRFHQLLLGEEACGDEDNVELKLSPKRFNMLHLASVSNQIFRSARGRQGFAMLGSRPAGRWLPADLLE